MNKYRLTVNLIVEVDAFDETDAIEAIQDNFGVGDTSGLTVVDCEIK